MIRVLSLGIVLLSIQTAAAAPSPLGYWLTPDRDGIIRITECGVNLCGELAGVVLDHPTDPTPVDHRGVSQCHLRLINDARMVRSNLWRGHIVNPRNGDVYGVEFRLEPNNNLALRGFLGVPLLGRTQTWTRYNGRVPSDCRMLAGHLFTEKAPALSRPPALSRNPEQPQ